MSCPRCRSTGQVAVFTSKLSAYFDVCPDCRGSGNFKLLGECICGSSRSCPACLGERLTARESHCFRCGSALVRTTKNAGADAGMLVCVCCSGERPTRPATAAEQGPVGAITLKAPRVPTF